MNTCPECKGQSFETLTPEESMNLYDTCTDYTMVFCANCQVEVTDIISAQNEANIFIKQFERFLTLPTLQKDYLDPNYFNK